MLKREGLRPLLPPNMSDLTDEEILRLKELAKDLEAYGRVGRKIRAGIIWAASGIVAWWVVWENILKHIFWRG